MPPRSYVSPARSAAAAETRERVIEAASRTLREGESIARFSLDTVAKVAGVTRLTVYNQCGAGCSRPCSTRSRATAACISSPTP